ncbi:13761_t:CDS:2 [Entrophospora sp. SA101]|nr:13761_t:CDS:2 [Entrophospora sp. SA101]CAJ0919398.1 19066_t:CDS:2 [Entrophospora sp. SA101]
MAETSSKIPVTVFTGFLGSGKTTIIISLLKRVPKSYKICLLKNEFGDMKVDSELVRESNIEVQEMLNGCLCCVLVGQMKTALLELKGAMIMNKSEPTTKNSQNTTENLNEADEYIQMAIKFHESNELEKATYYFRMAADRNSPLGLFLYGIALRHGWGCKPDPMLAVQYLRQAANSAISDLQATVEANPTIARHELVLAIYELGICFRHGWGVAKNKQMAAHYFEMAANFGDPDAQNDLAFCYLHGEGVKKDMKKAAKYYRMADTQGAGTLGNSWIYKKKYVEDNK